jgi:hypothetical protein
MSEGLDYQKLSLDYDKLLLETIRHIEDINVKFALQNYAAAGAIFLAHYTGHITSVTLTALAVVGVSLVFTVAICFNLRRYDLFWCMHRITRDSWLTDLPLRQALRSDQKCED